MPRTSDHDSRPLSYNDGQSAILKDPSIDSDQESVLPRDCLGNYIYSQIMLSSPPHQWSPTMGHPDTEASTSGKVVTGSKRLTGRRNQCSAADSPGDLGTTLPTPGKRNLLQPLQHRVGQALDIETKSHTERLEEAIKNLRSEIQDSLNKQTDVLRVILDVLKDGNRRSWIDIQRIQCLYGSASAQKKARQLFQSIATQIVWFDHESVGVDEWGPRVFEQVQMLEMERTYNEQLDYRNQSYLWGITDLSNTWDQALHLQ
ncbi:hypothetical protein EDD16DRAFT_1522229 [Pisolithus croceorrhizus]|nr:hypothetical protein EDD16DRAFT_1522229 [Pisolithus croceorrhizus]